MAPSDSRYTQVSLSLFLFKCEALKVKKLSENFFFFDRCGVCYGGSTSKNESTGVDKCGRCAKKYFNGHPGYDMKASNAVPCPCPEGTTRDKCGQCLQRDDPERDSKSTVNHI